MGVKSLEDLKKIRDEAKKNMDVRTVGEEEGNIKILVGMATCGIAAGARETFNAILDEIEKHKLKNIYVVQVGCTGHCYAEPVVQINMPGKDSIIYGHIDKNRGRQIIERHIIKGEPLEDLIIENDLERI